jgi:hypothetical protein
LQLLAFDAVVWGGLVLFFATTPHARTHTSRTLRRLPHYFTLLVGTHR